VSIHPGGAEPFKSGKSGEREYPLYGNIFEAEEGGIYTGIGFS